MMQHLKKISFAGKIEIAKINKTFKNQGSK